MTSISNYRLVQASVSTSKPPSLQSFVIHAPPGTDLWRKPSNPPVNSDTAPLFVTTTSLHAFQFAEVTISATWTRLYDQGGLVLKLSGGPHRNSSWVKTGIEFYNLQPNVSTVATPALSTSDWSLLPVENGTVRIRVERERGEGPALWVYVLKENGDKLALREVTWFFEGSGHQELLVGVYAARPTKESNDTDELEVRFDNLVVNLSA